MSSEYDNEEITMDQAIPNPEILSNFENLLEKLKKSHEQTKQKMN